MQFLKSNFGVKTFVLCWILVLLVPTWRDRAQQQWRSEQLAGEYLTPARYISKNPPTIEANDWKRQLELIRQEVDSVPEPISEAESAPASSLLERKKQRNALIERKLRKNDHGLEQYRALSRKFPRENDIRKTWIVAATRGSLRIEDTKEQPKRNPISDAALEAVIQCTLEGAKIEPQNSFFPVMQAVFLFALKRDNEALSAIHRAANCGYFDDGTHETVLRRIEIQSRTQRMTWFQKDMVLWSIVLPHFSAIHYSKSVALKMADQKRKHGEKMGALEIAYDLQRIGETFGQGQQYMIVMSIGRSQMVEAWKRAVGNVEITYSNNESNLGEKRLKAAHAFAAYARKLGREDIAISALKADQNLKKYDSYRNWPYYNAPIQKDMYFLSTSYWLQSQFVRMAFIGAIAWVFSLIFASKLEFQTLSTRRTLFSWASFCVGITTIFFALGIYFFTSRTESYNFLFSSDNPELTNRRQGFEALAPYVLALIWLMPTLFLTGKQYATYFLARHKGGARFQWNTALLNTLYLIIFVLFNVLFFANNGFEPKISFLLTFWPMQLLVFLLAVFIATIFHLWNSKGANRIAAVLFWGGVWISMLFLYYVSFDSEFITLACGGTSILLIVLSALVRVKILAANGFVFNWKIRFHCPNYFFDFVYRIRIVAAILCVCTSLSYIACNLVTLPANSRMSATVDRQLEIGEIAWLDEQKHAPTKN